MLKRIVKTSIFILCSVLAQYSIAAGLALKYDFMHQQEQRYRNVIGQPNVQVVAARNYASKQPPAPTLSYSYPAPSSAMQLAVNVVAAKNYYERIVGITHADLTQDYLQTFVVGPTFNSKGYILESKQAIERVEAAIAANPLQGCAPLSINCSRTGSTNEQLSIRRGPVKVEATEQPKQRQLLNP